MVPSQYSFFIYIKTSYTYNSIFSLIKFIEKSWEFIKDHLFITFTDHEKAFDTISRNKIWECLKRLEINIDLTERIKQTYEKTTKLCENKQGRSECSKPNSIWFNIIMN
jgi:hypothetical protein